MEGVTSAAGKSLGKGSASAGLFVPLCWAVDGDPPFGDPCVGAQAGEQCKPSGLGLSPAQPCLAQPYLLHQHSQAATQTCSASLVASKALALGPCSLVSKPFPALQSQDPVPGIYGLTLPCPPRPPQASPLVGFRLPSALEHCGGFSDSCCGHCLP